MRGGFSPQSASTRKSVETTRFARSRSTASTAALLLAAERERLAVPGKNLERAEDPELQHTSVVAPASGNYEPGAGPLALAVGEHRVRAAFEACRTVGS